MEPEAIAEILQMIGSVGAPAVAVILSMKYAINGMRVDVQEIKQDVKEIKASAVRHEVRLTVLEMRAKHEDAA